MLSRPGGSPSAWGAVPGTTFGTPWKMRRFAPPNTSRSPRAQLDVGERAGAPVDAGQAEHARVAEADRHHRRGRRLLAVLVQAEVRAGRVEVDDRGVGRRTRAAPGRRRTSSATARRASSSTRRPGSGFTGAPSVSSAVREYAYGCQCQPRHTDCTVIRCPVGTRGWRSPAGGAAHSRNCATSAPARRRQPVARCGRRRAAPRCEPGWSARPTPRARARAGAARPPWARRASSGRPRGCSCVRVSVPIPCPTHSDRPVSPVRVQILRFLCGEQGCGAGQCLKRGPPRSPGQREPPMVSA